MTHTKDWAERLAHAGLRCLDVSKEICDDRLAATAETLRFSPEIRELVEAARELTAHQPPLWRGYMRTVGQEFSADLGRLRSALAPFLAKGG